MRSKNHTIFFKENEYCVIIAKHSGKCLDVSSINFIYGANIT